MEDRSKAREAAFKALFQLEFNEGEDSAVERALEDYDLKARLRRRVEEAVKGTRQRLGEIDEVIQAHLKSGWKVSRLATTDRNILRLAVYEMQFAEKLLSPGIAINEALNLAKSYGSSDDSGKFINGVLSSISGTKRK